MTFADKVIAFNSKLRFTNVLPDGIEIMNPFKSNPHINQIAAEFYKKFYDDNKMRHMILGINPGRFGAGVTGVPFTDSKRLTDMCGINSQGLQTHEPSSVFIYDVIGAFGGVKKFYSKFYINSVCPLGFTIKSNRLRTVNYNYYDSLDLMEACYKFIVKSIRSQIDFGINTDACFCMGTGKNFKFLEKLNAKEKFFDNVIPLEHPRYVIQYKLKSKKVYIDKYIDQLMFKMPAV
ncbi:MAG: uracil-DNA glycosylase family protein [Ignavibacteria bacterium]